jgi:hypothetical protein
MTSTTVRSGRSRGAARGRRLLPLLLLSFSCLAASIGHAYAMTSSNDALAGAFADGDSSFKEMSTDDMSSQRGGFDGIAFGIFLNGTVTTLATNQLPAGVTAEQTGPSQIQIVGAVGSLGNATGIFQFVNVVGNSNVINNNVIINIAVLPSTLTGSDGTFTH